MRALYSAGRSDEKAVELYKNLLSGKDRLEVGSNGETAETIKSENGGRVIRVASLGKDRNSRLHLGVVLGHEAHRDGVGNGEAGQNAETFESVFAHTRMAREMEKDYQGFIASDETLARDVAEFERAKDTGEWGRFAAYVGASYDSSADYWKLTRDGRLINDNKVGLTWADTGEMIVENSDTGSISQALIQYVGMERAEELLGSNFRNSDLYDIQTLVDVLGITENQAAEIKIRGQLNGEISVTQQQKLLGEALMKNNGLEWESNGWYGNDDASFKITDKNVAGQITFSDKMINGVFEKFTLTANVSRNELSYRGSIGDLTSQALDSVTIEKRDLDGNVLDNRKYDGFQTVDIMSAGERNQPYSDPVYGDIQGNTIEAGSFFSRIGQASNYPEPVWVVRNAVTVDSTVIDGKGYASGSNEYDRSGRWLWHQNRNNDQNNNFGIDYDKYFVDGCFSTSTENWIKINEYIADLGAKAGYDVFTVLEEKRY